MNDVQELIQRLAPGARIDQSGPLTGGVSAQVVAVDFTRVDGMSERVVLRRRREHAWKPGAADGVVREHALLGLLHGRGLPVPRPRLVDAAAGVIVLDFVAGRGELPQEPAAAMAATLARIHAATLEGLPELPVCDDPRPELRAWWAGDPVLEDMLRGRGDFTGAATLLHGDFWPGNLVWRGGEIVAVLDWEDAAVGDPLSDLACARVELACAAGEAVAQEFTAHYLEGTGRDAARLPLWELYVSTAALASMDQWGLAPEVLAARRSITEAFQRRARAALGLD